jgi:glycosyltransferase involved in cell wall biosynthesis
MNQLIKVIIPAYNEQDAIAYVIHDIPSIVDEVILVNNNSTDNTEIHAKNAGATILHEKRKGYGYACLKGLEYIANLKPDQRPTIVVFLYGDYSDSPDQLTEIIAPIINDDIDFVLGTRVKRLREQGSLLPQQIFGNWLATSLMKFFFDATYTDLGPFRAIKYDKLLALEMEDKTYGWTIEMQLKALRQQLKYVEVPVRYKNRIGVSKVSGTVKGSVYAGVKILSWIFKYSFK